MAKAKAKTKAKTRGPAKAKAKRGDDPAVPVVPVPPTVPEPAPPVPEPGVDEPAALERILKRLDELVPRVRKIPVEDTTGPQATMLFLDVDDLCLITTDSDDPKFSLMFVNRDERRFYGNGGLVDYERQLADNRYWLRTSLKHLVNLNRIERSRVNRARDPEARGDAGLARERGGPQLSGRARVPGRVPRALHRERVARWRRSRTSRRN